MSLKYKVVILTEDSSGIGELIALRLGEEGARVVVIARRFERLKELEKRSTDFKGEIYPVAGHMSKDEDIKNVVKVTIKEYGKVDVLINSAGVLDRFLSANNMRDEVWDYVIAVNLTGLMKLIREVMPYMLEQSQEIL